MIYAIYSREDSKYNNGYDMDILRCFNCGEEIEESYNYCPNCKVRLRKQCEGCGKMISVNWRHCPYCEHPNS